MNSSFSRGIIGGVLVLVGGLAPGFGVFAQDVLLLKNGQERSGVVLGVSQGKVALKVGPAQSAIPLDQVESAEVGVPPELDAAREKMASGDAKAAMGEVQGVVARFSGLPVSWMGEAHGMLVELLLDLDQRDEAEATLSKLKELHPEEVDLAAVSIARLEAAKGNWAEAKQRIEPVIAEAMTLPGAGRAKSATIGRAFLLMGQIHEQEGMFPEALADYLRTVTIFYADSAAVADAQMRADRLVEEKNVIAP